MGKRGGNEKSGKILRPKLANFTKVSAPKVMKDVDFASYAGDNTPYIHLLLKSI